MDDITMQLVIRGLELLYIEKTINIITMINNILLFLSSIKKIN